MSIHLLNLALNTCLYEVYQLYTGRYTMHIKSVVTTTPEVVIVAGETSEFEIVGNRKV